MTKQRVCEESLVSRWIPVPPRSRGREAEWTWSWSYEAESSYQRRCRKTAFQTRGPETLLSCWSTGHLWLYCPCCVGKSNWDWSSPGSRTWNCVPACCRSLPLSWSSLCSTLLRRPPWSPPTPPPSTCVRSGALDTAPGPSCWSAPGGLGTAGTLTVWSLPSSRQTRAGRGSLCWRPASCCRSLGRGSQCFTTRLLFQEMGNHALYHKTHLHCRNSDLVFGSVLAVVLLFAVRDRFGVIRL